MKTLQNRITKLIWLLILSYGIVVTVYTVLQLTIGERFIVITWLNNGAYLLWAGAIVLIVPSIVFRRWRILGWMLIPAIVFTLNYLPMYLPKHIQPTDDAQLLTVLTYNINYAPPDLNAIAEDIRIINADVVAIQELTPHAVDMFESRLSQLYPYRAFHPVDSFYGQGVMSKHPITDDEYWKIYLGHQRVELDVNGTSIAVYNVPSCASCAAVLGI